MEVKQKTLSVTRRNRPEVSLSKLRHANNTTYKYNQTKDEIYSHALEQRHTALTFVVTLLLQRLNCFSWRVASK